MLMVKMKKLKLKDINGSHIGSPTRNIVGTRGGVGGIVGGQEFLFI